MGRGLFPSMPKLSRVGGRCDSCLGVRGRKTWRYELSVCLVVRLMRLRDVWSWLCWLLFPVKRDMSVVVLLLGLRKIVAE